MTALQPLAHQALTVAIVPAAGRGLRMGGSVPKQFLEIGGLPLVVYSLRVLQAAPSIDTIVLAVPQADIAYCQTDIVNVHGFSKVSNVVAGGPERQDSVRLAMAAVGS
jgi:2-C-methyl-D-erythritol 4-phosphate cytidylyltransferase